MKYRDHTLLAQTTYEADKTEIIDIDVQDPISQIGISYRPTFVSVDTIEDHPVSCLKKIEIVDGSEVLFSLTGAEAQALDFYSRLIEAYNRMNYTIGGTPEVWVFINFGRYLWDTELAFDPKVFVNPQLKIQVDIDAADAEIVTGDMRVFARLFDEKSISPVGFLMSKEIQQYSLSNDAHKYIDMPIDHAWRKLLIRAQRDGAEFTSQLDHLKLSQDADKKVIFDQACRDVVFQQISQTPPYREHHYGSGYTVAMYRFCTPSLYVRFGGVAWRASIGGGYQAFYGGAGGRYQQVQASAGPNWQCFLEGWLPHAMLEYPFGIQNDIDDWFDVSGIGSLKLDLTAGSSVGTSTCEVCLQQLRRY